MSVTGKKSLSLFVAGGTSRVRRGSDQNVFNVLVVEDCAADRVTLREVFSEYGPNYRLHFACDGSEALNFCKNKGGYLTSPRPDLALLDINLPGLSGFEV